MLKRGKAFVYIETLITTECAAAVMTRRDPSSVWEKLNMACQSVFEASIETKLKRLHAMK